MRIQTELLPNSISPPNQLKRRFGLGTNISFLPKLVHFLKIQNIQIIIKIINDKTYVPQCWFTFTLQCIGGGFKP